MTIIFDVAFGPSNIGENNYAKRLVQSVPNESLTIFDRCYFSVELLVNWQRAHQTSHWMVPIKRNTQYEVIQTLGDNDFVRYKEVSAKKILDVYFERWGILIAYNLVRVEISQIAKEAKVFPLRISFMMALREEVGLFKYLFKIK